MYARFALLASQLVLYGCAPSTSQRAQEASLRRQVSAEVARICALPEPQSQQEISRVYAESGMAIVCPRR